MTCEARVQGAGDELFCKRCSLRWPVGDENPPPCKPKVEPRRVQSAREVENYARRYREASGR